MARTTSCNRNKTEEEIEIDRKRRRDRDTDIMPANAKEMKRDREIILVRLLFSGDHLNTAAWERDNRRRELRLDTIYFGSDMWR